MSPSAAFFFCTASAKVPPYDFFLHFQGRRRLVGMIGKVIIEKSVVRDFYGTGIEIWAGFWPIGSTEKKDLGRL